MRNWNNLKFQPLTRTLSAQSRKWFFDLDVCKYNAHGRMSHQFPNYDQIDSNNQCLFAVILQKTNVHIGNVLLDINWVNRSAEYSCIFGERNYWNMGFGFEATEMMFIHGFDVLNLNRIWLGTPETNIAMGKIARRLDMVYEGRLMSDMYLEGEYHDVMRYGILRSAWR